MTSQAPEAPRPPVEPHKLVPYNLCPRSVISAFAGHPIPVIELPDEDVASFLAREKCTPDEVIASIQELFKRYKDHELRIHEERRRLLNQLPDLERTLDVVQTLSELAIGSRITTTYTLADGVLGDAELEVNGKVNLWLGANTMLEHTYEEAASLLTESLASTGEQLKNADTDAGVLRDQIITAEVSVARFYNHTVKKGSADTAAAQRP